MKQALLFLLLATVSQAARRADASWWSLQPIQAPDGSIDSFVEARLSEAGLQPSPQADRRTLIRRLTFDLIGLPPTPAEIADFLADARPDAYERLVDRLLESPHYGERWARHWLDVARFGESHGFEYNQPRNDAWPYRNWVVDALNADMPFDEFTRMQIAGDVITENAAAGVIATGFLVAGPHNTTRPQSDPMRKTMVQDELEGVIAAVGQGFLGLTINCARCHDHKFDPITIKDYYEFAATLGGITPAVQKVIPEPQAEAKEKAEALKRERRLLKNQVVKFEEAARQAILAERADQPAPAGPTPTAAWDFTVGLKDQIGDLHVSLHNGARQDAQGLHVDGKQAFASSAVYQQDTGEKTLEAWVQVPDLNQRGGGIISLQTKNGTTFDAIVYGEREPKRWMVGSNNFRRYASFKGAEETETKALVHVAMVFHKGGRITAYRNGQPYGEAYAKPPLQPYKAGDSQFVFGLRHAPVGGNRMFHGRITQARFYNRALGADAIAASAGQASSFVGRDQILARLSPEEREKRARFDAIEAELKALESGITPMAVWAARPGRPPAAHVLTRGSVRQPGEEVVPNGIAVLPHADFALTKTAGDGERRRKLAEWITHADNPLFARVAVNRLWHHHFAVGIVDTPNDFGYSGGRPSHPELLDFLASRLKAEGYRLKPIHRLIVTSSTYRQAAAPRSEAMAVDADNRLLWRMQPKRLAGEALRDAMLAISAKLDPTIGGRGYRDVREYRHKGSHFYDPIPQDKPEQFRRTLYRFNPRGAKRTMLDTFDCPDPSAITPSRATTTTPLQSLALMNNALVLRLADAFAKRLEPETAPVATAYALAYGRPPNPDERRVSADFIASHDLAAYCRILFNSNEFLYVR